ncbi:MAG: hypothetical protein D4S01_03850 [Dehalococcoidia bacterium]|nr:MAG: hypothetical protein D4S01_03850 [Dehalococcoidia bacterium]
MDPITGLILGGVGALSGGAAGGMGASRRGTALDDLMSNLVGISGEIGERSSQRQAELNKTYGGLTEGYAGDFQDYQDALRNADFSQYDIEAPGEFEFDFQGEVDRLMNPMLDEIINRSSGAVESSAANRGKLFSGATGKNIARNTADITAAEVGRAQGLATTREQNKYSQFIDGFNSLLKANEFNRSNMTAGLDAQGDAVKLKGDAFNTQQTGIQGIQAGEDQAYFQNQGLQADAGFQRANTPSVLQGVMEGALGGGSAGLTSAAKFGA